MEQAPREKNGRFLPGAVGNPKGRTPENVKAATLRKRIMKAAPDVVDALIAAAKAGDVNAGRALLVCACPPLKPAELPVSLPINADAGLAEQGRAVVAALAGGLIAPGQASQILTALAGIARLVELDEIEKRLSALERTQPGPQYRPNVVYIDDIDAALPE